MNATDQGWKLKDWLRVSSISRGMFYRLEVKPRCVRLGRRLVVIESPREYLERVAKIKGEDK